MKLKKLKEIKDLRLIWKHEEYDFSTWLIKEENLSDLSEVVGITIINPEKEASIGSFSVDIKAETENQKIVIIENQLEKTNHDHLGKIITYASGLNAEYVIWIVKTAREEHKKAIDWLNENSTENLNLFLIEIKIYQIGDSDFAPQFQVVSSPNNWSKILKNSDSKELKTRQILRLEFWEKFLEYANITHRKIPKDHWLTLAVGSSKYHLSLLTSKLSGNKGAACEFNFHSDEEYLKAFTKSDEINLALNLELTWKKSTNGGICYTQFDYQIIDKKKWQEIYEFYVQTSQKLKSVIPRFL